MPSYTQNTPDSPREPLEPGRYPFEVVDAEETISKNNSEMIELKMKVPGRGNHVWDNLVFVAKAFWKIDQFLAAIGTEIKPGAEVDVQPSKLIGKRGIFVVGVEQTTAGNDRNRVERYVLPEDYDDDDRFAMEQGASSPRGESSPTGDDTEDDGDIPF